MFGVMSQSSGFSPSDIIWGQLWYTGSTEHQALSLTEGITIGDTLPMTQGTSLSQSTGTLQGLHRGSVSELGGQDAVEFDGTDDYYVASGLSIPLTATLLIVFRRLSASDPAATENPAATGLSRLRYSTTSTPQSVAGGNAQSGTVNDFRDTNVHTIMQVVESTQHTLYVDGTSYGPKAATVSADSAHAVGALTSGSLPTYMQATFSGVYLGDLTSDGAYSDLQTWMSDTYGATL